jgi:hypothetical protein
MRRPAKPDSLMLTIVVFGLGTLLTATLQAALG